MTRRRDPSDRRKRPLDAVRLDELALAYVARFATSRAKLARYLSRKIGESDWIDEADARTPCEAGVAKMERLGFVADRQYAEMRGASMTRVGYEARRVEAQLWVGGLDGGAQTEA